MESAEFYNNLSIMKTYEQGETMGNISELTEQVEFSNQAAAGDAVAVPSLPTTRLSKNLFFDAVSEGQFEEARNLLQMGADVNWRDEESDMETALHYAVERNDSHVVDLLLAQPGVNVNIKTLSNEMTPLSMACGLGLEEMTRKLLRAPGIKLNIRCRLGNTALHYAAAGDFTTCLELLRDSPGADMLLWTLKNDEMESPLYKAVMENAIGSLGIILGLPISKMGKLENTDSYGIVWYAICNDLGEAGDRDKIVEMLSEDQRINFNLADVLTGDTPLLHCLKEKKVEMSKIILKNPRVDLNVKNNAGEFPESIAR